MEKEIGIFNDDSLQNDIRDVVAIEQGILRVAYPLPDLDEELGKIMARDDGPAAAARPAAAADGRSNRHALRMAMSALLGAAAMVAVILAWQWLGRDTGAATTPAMNEADRNGMAYLQTSGGEKVTLTLADGTEVVLNSNSRLEYPHRFKGGERAVRLQGEAFFKVRHDEARPFIVDAHGVVTEDLGTAFNICGRAENDCRVTVVEGSVRVTAKRQGAKPVVLTPGQEYSLPAEVSAPKVETVNTDEVIAWVDDIYYYHDQTVEQVATDVARIYNMSLDIRNTNAATVRIDFSTGRHADLTETISLLNGLGIARFRVDGRSIVVE